MTTMSNTGNLLDNAIEAANKAVKFDEEAETNIAAYYYEAASSLLEQLTLVTDPEKAEPLIAKANQYKLRAKDLQKRKIPEEPNEGNSRMIKVKQCFFLLQQAIEEDEHGEKDDAIELYIKAVEYIRQFPDLMQGELKKLTLQALDRAEELKGIKKCLPTKLAPSLSLKANNHVDEKSTSLSSNEKLTLNSDLQVTGNDAYSEEEKEVLLFSSQINKRNYVPFMSIDLSEKFQYSIPFSDQDGPLILAPKQKKDFYKFARPEELCSDPCIVSKSVPNYLNIKQTVISDCSFVASLAVSASYEKRFGKKLVTAIIFPQSRDKQPLYNPFGKYMMKLHINGIARKVIIDDRLPIDKFGRLLCSYSSNKNEFWISLLEKAYMKVMGGYDFPGSNSNIDLYALTGWIPERTSIRFNERDFDKDSLFTKLESRLANGDVLVTVATGELSDVDAERSGLVPTHAYAVMDVQTINGVRLLKLKNPWSHLRWRGNYSELDTKHWTLELQQRLNYDPNSAVQFDNGVFWIDYDSVCSFFDVFYMNWNPNLFKYTHCIHQSWNSGSGPAKDLYTMTSNPQFSLGVQEESSGAVWLLLTRHIVDIEDFRENKEYITLFIYKNGKRVYYPFDPPPYIDGVKINSPHYLCKMIIGPDSARKYTVVISQYEKSTTIYYTLRAYSTCPFVLTKILDPFVYEDQITGEWRGSSAGGCPNHPLTYTKNPKYKLEIDSTSNRNHVLIELKGPKQYNIGMEVIIQEVKDETVTAPFKSRSSGSYRSGYVVLELGEIPAGTLMIIPSTFSPNQEGPFILVAKSSTKIRLSRLQL